tara:strand:- start:547 stop:729 length:183 start_codon:yes stop_codon:yes gene_type:complete
MLDKIKKIFKRKPKPKAKIEEEVLVLAEDKTFENEIQKSQVDERVSETKSETKSSLTLGE